MSFHSFILFEGSLVSVMHFNGVSCLIFPYIDYSVDNSTPAPQMNLNTFSKTRWYMDSTPDEFHIYFCEPRKQE